MGEALKGAGSISTLDAAWQEAVDTEDYDLAYLLGMEIARTPAGDVSDLLIKVRHLVEYVRPASFGVDQPEHHILLRLAADIARVVHG